MNKVEYIQITVYRQEHETQREMNLEFERRMTDFTEKLTTLDVLQAATFKADINFIMFTCFKVRINKFDPMKTL